jgi:HrpA-like RNA helicase
MTRRAASFSILLRGETGCGKSSEIPLAIVRDAVARGQDVNVIVTQPRRLAARALCNRQGLPLIY